MLKTRGASNPASAVASHAAEEIHSELSVKVNPTAPLLDVVLKLTQPATFLPKSYVTEELNASRERLLLEDDWPSRRAVSAEREPLCKRTATGRRVLEEGARMYCW